MLAFCRIQSECVLFVRPKMASERGESEKAVVRERRAYHRIQLEKTFGIELPTCNSLVCSKSKTLPDYSLRLHSNQPFLVALTVGSDYMIS